MLPPALPNAASALWLAKWLAGGLVIGTFLAINLIGGGDPDMGWHLRVGEWIAANRAVPRADIYSFTMPGHPWVDHEWLTNLAFWWLHTRGAWWFAIGTFSLMAATPFVAWIFRAQFLAGIGIVLTAALLGKAYLDIRPHTLSFFLFFILFEIIRRHLRQPAKRDRLFLAIPFLFLLWANLHAGFAGGIMLLFLAIGFRAVEYWRTEKRFRYPGITRDGAVFLASVAATLVNPYGWNLYREIYRVLASKPVAQYIDEWHAAPSVEALVLLFSILLGIYLFFILRYWRGYSAPELGISFFYLISFLRAAKGGPLFMISALPVLHRGTLFAHEELRVTRQGIPIPRVFRYSAYAFTLFMAVILVAAVARTRPITYPTQAAAFLRTAVAEGEVRELFASYGLGGYLLWNVPGLQLFIDGRMPHWVDRDGRSIMEDYVTVAIAERRGTRAWEEVFARRNVTVAMASNIGTIRVEAAETPTAIESLLRRLAGIPFVAKLINDHWNVKVGPALNNTAVPSLKAILIQDGWHTLYEDTDMIILRCPPARCPKNDVRRSP